MSNNIEVPRTNCKLCTHAFAGGRVCASPALRGQAFCYFHHPTRRRVRNPNESRARRIARQSFALNPPSNHADLQLALNEVILRLAANAIDPRRAGLLLFGLQIASQSFSSAAPTPGGGPLADLLQLFKTSEV